MQSLHKLNLLHKQNHTIKFKLNLNKFESLTSTSERQVAIKTKRYKNNNLQNMTK